MKKINKFPYKRVRIYWQDPTSNPEWMSLKKALEQTYSWCDDIGYLLYKDQKKLIIFFLTTSFKSIILIFQFF